MKQKIILLSYLPNGATRITWNSNSVVCESLSPTLSLSSTRTHHIQLLKSGVALEWKYAKKYFHDELQLIMEWFTQHDNSSGILTKKLTDSLKKPETVNKISIEPIDTGNDEIVCKLTFQTRDLSKIQPQAILIRREYMPKTPPVSDKPELIQQLHKADKNNSLALIPILSKSFIPITKGRRLSFYTTTLLTESKRLTSLESLWNKKQIFMYSPTYGSLESFTNQDSKLILDNIIHKAENISNRLPSKKVFVPSITHGDIMIDPTTKSVTFVTLRTIPATKFKSIFKVRKPNNHRDTLLLAIYHKSPGKNKRVIYLAKKLLEPFVLIYIKILLSLMYCLFFNIKIKRLVMNK